MKRHLNSDVPQKEKLKINTSDSRAESNSIVEKDVFIKKVFESNPKEGCGLLFEYYYTVLCSHAARFVYSQNIAEDIVTEVFENFWAKKVFLQVEISYRNYLYTSVRNASLNYLKKEFKKYKYLDLSLAENEANLSDTPYQNFKLDEMTLLIERCVQSLAPKCQAVFVMSRFINQNVADAFIGTSFCFYFMQQGR